MDRTEEKPEHGALIDKANPPLIVSHKSDSQKGGKTGERVRSTEGGQGWTDRGKKDRKGGN